MDLCGQQKRGNKAPNGVVCHSKEVSVHDMWKRHQEFEGGKKMCGTKVVDEGHKTQVQKMVKFENGTTWHGKNIEYAGRNFGLVQGMLWLCATKDGTNVGVLV